MAEHIISRKVLFRDVTDIHKVEKSISNKTRKAFLVINGSCSFLFFCPSLLSIDMLPSTATVPELAALLYMAAYNELVLALLLKVCDDWKPFCRLAQRVREVVWLLAKYHLSNKERETSQMQGWVAVLRLTLTKRTISSRSIGYFV